MWRNNVGLCNRLSNRFLQAETFGFKVNANGNVVKRKQLWSLECFDPFNFDTFCLKSYLDRYLAVDTIGLVTGQSEKKTERCRFQIVLYQANQSEDTPSK